MLYFVEASTTGSGLTMIRALSDAGRDVALVTSDAGKYQGEHDRSALEILRERDQLQTVANTDTFSTSGFAVPSRPDSRHGVIAASDRHLTFAADLAEYVGAPFLTPHAVSVLRDKRKARRLYDACGVGHIRWSDAPSAAAVGDFVREVSTQVLLKNVAGSGSQDIRVAGTEDDAILAWEDLMRRERWLDGEIMVEEYIRGPLVSLEVLVNEHRPIFLGTTDRQIARLPSLSEIGYTFPAPTGAEHETSMKEAVTTVVEALDIRNSFLHVEFILTPGCSHLVEINARLPGALVTYMLRDCLDDDFYGMVHDSAMGLRVPEPALNGLTSSAFIAYAPRTGIAASDSDAVGARSYPWVVDVLGGVKEGDPVGPAVDFRGSVGHVRTVGPSSTLTRAAATAAAELLLPDLK
jgi:biotin carboxylase